MFDLQGYYIARQGIVQCTIIVFFSTIETIFSYESVLYGLAALIVIKMLTLPQLYATGAHACLAMSR